MIEMDMALETELGVDSIKRVEILSDVQKELNVEAQDVAALSRTQTVGEVVEAMIKELARHPRHRRRAVGRADADRRRIAAPAAVASARRPRATGARRQCRTQGRPRATDEVSLHVRVGRGDRAGVKLAIAFSPSRPIIVVDRGHAVHRAARQEAAGAPGRQGRRLLVRRGRRPSPARRASSSPTAPEDALKAAIAGRPAVEASSTRTRRRTPPPPTSTRSSAGLPRGEAPEGTSRRRRRRPPTASAAAPLPRSRAWATAASSASSTTRRASSRRRPAGATVLKSQRGAIFGPRARRSTSSGTTSTRARHRPRRRPLGGRRRRRRRRRAAVRRHHGARGRLRRRRPALHDAARRSSSTPPSTTSGPQRTPVTRTTCSS